MHEPLTQGEIEAASANAAIGTDLVLAEAGMRVWHLYLKPGQTLAAHRHDRPYFWTVLAGGIARSRDGEGRVLDVTFVARETRHFADLGPHDAFVHDLTNIGDTELVFVTAEFDRSSA